MKKNLSMIIVSTLIFIFGCTSLPTPDLSTPEKAWEAFRAAVQSGNIGKIKKVCTDEGYNKMLGKFIKSCAISPKRNQLIREHIDYYKDGCYNETIKWDKKELENEISGHIALSRYNHMIIFKKINGKWKMDRWLPGIKLLRQ